MKKLGQVIRTELLDDIEDERFIIFEAPRGYGKTYAAKQLIERITDRTCLYFTPLPWEKTFKQFASRFIGEMRRTLGSEYLQFTYTLLESETATTDIIINRFTRELLDVRAKLQIIIDDFNLLNDDVQQFIITTLLFVPENIDISICSRKKISYKLPRGLRKDIKIVSENELIFSEDEATELLTDYRKIDEIKAFYRATGGWPLGLDLVKRSKFDGVGDVPVSSSDILELRKLFEEEVFAPQSEPTRDFLLQTSLLPYFDFNLVRGLFGEVGVELLDKLILENLFVEEAERGHYRYYQPFSDFLRDKTGHSLSEDERREFQSKAGIALIELNRQDEGFRFLSNSEDWGAYSQAIMDNLLWFEGAVTSKYRIEFGGELPTRVCEKYPGLAYLKAIYEFFQGKSEEAFRLFKLHLDKPDLNTNLKVRFLMYSYVCTLQLSEKEQGETTIQTIRETLAQLEKIPDTSELTNRLNRAILMFALSKAEFQRANYEEQDDLLSDAMMLTGDIDSFIYHSIARDQLDKLEDYSEEREKELIEIIEKLPDEAADMKSGAMYLLFSLYINSDETEKAENLLNQLRNLNENTSMFFKGLKFEAERGFAVAKKDIWYLLNVLEEGIRFLAFSPRQVMLHDWRAHYMMALIAVGDTDKAIAYFERNYGSLREPDYPRSRIRLLLAYLALLTFDINKNELKRNVVNLERNEIEYLNKIDRYSFTLIRLINSYQSGDRTIVSAYASELNEMTIPKVSITPFLLNQAIERFPGLADLIGDFIKKEGTADKPSIIVTLFGDLTIAGPHGELSYVDLRYRKSAELFALLVMNRGEPLSNERVVDTLLGESDETKGKNRIGIALHYLRKELATIGVKDIIYRKRGIIGIKPDIPIEIDVTIFEEKVSLAELYLTKGIKEQGYSELKSAIGIYRDDFLRNIYAEWCSRWFHYYRLKYEWALEKALEVSADLGYKNEFSKYINIISYDEDLKLGLGDKIDRLTKNIKGS